MESEPSLDLDSLVFTPGDPGFPFPSPSSDLLPVQSSHMESEPSLEVQNSASTGPTDVGFPFLAPSSELPPVQPSNLSIGRLRPEVAAALPSWKSPDVSSTHTDQELLENYLSPVVQGSETLEETRQRRISEWKPIMCPPSNPAAAVVNAGLPLMNPWELPGIMAGKQGRREKYYLTDHPQLSRLYKHKLVTPDGFWIQNEFCVVLGSSVRGTGIKRTYIWKDTSQCVDGTKTNWIMDIYNTIDGATMEDELVLCHVFEAPTDYNAKPKRPTCDQGRCRCSGKHGPEGINAPSNTSFDSISRGTSPMHHGPYQSRNPVLNSWMAMYEEVLLGDADPDPDSSMETENCSPTRGVSPTDGPGRSNKRQKSDVWDYFTKIYARDLAGNVVTLAACNNCSKVLSGNSTNGTRHLRDHACPCKFKPVPAGRKDKGVVNVLSSQPSFACR